AADALLLALARVEHPGAALQLAGVNPDKGQGAHEGIGGNLERQGGEGGVVVRLAGCDGFAVVEGALDGLYLGGGRQVLDHRIEDGLVTLVLEVVAAEHRHDIVGDMEVAYACCDLRHSTLLAVKALYHQLSPG